MIEHPSIFKKMPPVGKPIDEKRTTCAICGKEITPKDAKDIEYIHRRNGPDLWAQDPRKFGSMLEGSFQVGLQRRRSSTYWRR